MKTHSIHDLYREYHRRLDVRAVLEAYGAQNCSEHLGADGTTEIVHSCLLEAVEPHHAHGDARPSASANVEKGLYCCYSYWAGSIFSLVQKLEGVEGPDHPLEALTPYLSGSTREGDSVLKEIHEAFSESSQPPPMSAYSENVLDPWLVSHPWMRDVRGISQEAHELLKIGYDEKDVRIVFPHFFEGRLLGWQKRCVPEVTDDDGRSLWPATVPDYPKYKNSTGFPKSETLYAWDLAHGSTAVIVVESPMSVARAYSLGLSVPAVATFGAKVSDTQINLLADFDRVFIWYDDDPAGHAGERKLVEGLYRRTSVFVVQPESRDLGDFPEVGAVRKKLDEAMPAALWTRW